MEKIIKKIFDSVGKSIMANNGKTSSGRISGYFILGAILLFSLTFTTIVVINAIKSWTAGDSHVIPMEHIVIFGMILTHHLGLIFYKTKEYKGKNEFKIETQFARVEEETEDEYPMDNDVVVSMDNGEEYEEG